MSTNNDRQATHDMIDHIFHDLLPARGMMDRPEQTALSHRMLDALLDGSIALCDAGTGIGKTYAYLAAGMAFLRFHTTNGQRFRPIIISTSSIALQNAVQTEYLPTLSTALTEDGIIDQPLCAVIRKGKSHYVCDRRLERRLGQLDLSKKNWKAGRALLSLREQLDMGTVLGHGTGKSALCGGVSPGWSLVRNTATTRPRWTKTGFTGPLWQPLMNTAPSGRRCGRVPWSWSGWHRMAWAALIC